MGVQVSYHGLCASRDDHASHWNEEGDEYCPGYPEVAACINCDDRKCMACIFREVHDACEDSCPFCCAKPAVVDDLPARRSAALDEIERMLGNLTASAVQDALRAFRTQYNI